MNLSTKHTGWFTATQLACKQQLCLYWSPAYARQKCRGRFASHTSSVCRHFSSSMLLFHTHLPALLSYGSLRAFRKRECSYGGRWWKKAVQHPSPAHLRFQAEVNCWALNTLVTSSTSRGLVLPSLKQCSILREWNSCILQAFSSVII